MPGDVSGCTSWGGRAKDAFLRPHTARRAPNVNSAAAENPAPSRPAPCPHYLGSIQSWQWVSFRKNKGPQSSFLNCESNHSLTCLLKTHHCSGRSGPDSQVPISLNPSVWGRPGEQLVWVGPPRLPNLPGSGLTLQSQPFRLHR